MLLKIFALAAVALLTACMEPRPAPQESVQPAAQPAVQAPPPAGPAPSHQAGQTDFGIRLYRQLGAKQGNLFLSPTSISAALGMVYAGAEGETASEMAQALRYPATGVHESFGELLRRLPIEAEGRKVSVANALWVQQGFPLKPGYIALVRRHYGGGAQPVDFVGSPMQAIAAINGWAEEKTAGRIKGLLQRANINERTRLVLTNAVYFKGDWLHPFQANQTRARAFYLRSGGSVSVPFMRQRGGFRLLQEPDFAAVEMPYKGEELSMMLFVPQERQGLEGFEQRLTPDALSGWIEALRKSERRDIELVVPKLELDTRASLVPELQAMGMRRAFTDMAELKGIADAQLRLSDVIHQTYLRVDEKGTEAAAATAAIAEIVSMPWPFHADHPFFFLIRDNRTDAILFMGRIERPEMRTAG